MRRIVCAAIAIVMTGTAAQAFAGQLALGSASGAPGQSVSLPLTFRQGTGPVAVALGTDVSFNASALSKPRCGAGSALSTSGPTAKLVTCAEPSPGVLRIAVLGLNTAPLPDGEVATVTFDVAPGAREGVVALSVKAGGADALGTDFDLEHSDGSVKVTPAN